MSARADCSRVARGCNNQNCFLKSMNPLVRRMISEGAKKFRIADTLLRLPNKHQSNVNYVTKSWKELLAII